MRFRNSFGATGTRERRPLELGITPLIDIVFLLLIFFMLTSRFVAQEGIQVQLPVTDKPHSIESVERVRIYLLANGVVLFMGEAATIRELENLLSNVDNKVLEKPFEILADRTVPVQEVVVLLEMLRNRGAARVTIGTVSGGEEIPAGGL
jgi:biopolymer transport protein ExbD